MSAPRITVAKAAVTPASSWFNAAWGYRTAYVLTNEHNPDTHANAQIRVDLSAANFDFTAAKSDGSDLRVTDSDGTTALSFWIAAWDASGQTATILVMLPSVAARSARLLWLYHGNAGASTASSGPSVVYTPSTAADASLAAQWEFDAAATGNKAVGTAFLDATGNYTITVAGTGNAAIVGQGFFPAATRVGDFDGGPSDDRAFNKASNNTDTYATVTGGLWDTIPANGTLEMWVNTTATASRTIFWSKSNGDRSWEILLDVGYTWTVTLKGTTGGSNTVFGLTKVKTSDASYWARAHHLVLVVQDGSWTFYVDGQYVATTRWEIDMPTITNPAQIWKNDGGVDGGSSILSLRVWTGKAMTPREVDALYWRKRYAPGATETDRWVKNVGPIITAAPGNYVQEPKVIRYAGKFGDAWYLYAANAGVARLYTSPDLETWTDRGPVTGPSNEHFWVLPVNGRVYLYYPTTSGFRVSSSVNGYDFADADGGTPIITIPWTDNHYGGMGVFLEGGVFHAYGDAMDTVAGDNVWRGGYWTATSPVGPFTFVQRMSYDAAGGCLVKVDGVYHLWAGDLPGSEDTTPTANLPIHVFRRTSTDLVNWTIVPVSPSLTFTQRSWEVDQVTNPWVVESGGKCWLFYTGADNNGTFKASIGVARYDGTLRQLIARGLVAQDPSTTATAAYVAADRLRVTFAADADAGLAAPLTRTDAAGAGFSLFAASATSPVTTLARAEPAGDRSIDLVLSTPAYHGNAPTRLLFDASRNGVAGMGGALPPPFALTADDSGCPVAAALATPATVEDVDGRGPAAPHGDLTRHIAAGSSVTIRLSGPGRGRVDVFAYAPGETDVTLAVASSSDGNRVDAFADRAVRDESGGSSASQTVRAATRARFAVEDVSEPFLRFAATGGPVLLTFRYAGTLSAFVPG